MPIYALDDKTPALPPDGQFWIAPNATIIGDVVVEPGASIWFGAVLRGDNDRIHVGADANVQDNAVIHVDPGFPTSIGTGCTIGHNAIVHGCTLGDGVLVGMGATVLNGAQIGAGSVIGANALVTEGKVFPENSLIVGAPARAVRQLTPEQVMEFGGAARNYMANRLRFATGLRRLD